MLVTIVPTKVISGRPSKPIQLVLQNRNAALAANLLFGEDPLQLLFSGKVIAPGGTTPQLSIAGDLWVRGDVGNVDMVVDYVPV